MILPNDPYVIARNAATTSARDVGDDVAALGDPHPSESRGSPYDSQQSRITYSFFILLSPNRACRIMSPRKMTQAAIEKLVADKIVEAISQDRATRVNTNGAARSDGNAGQGGAPPAHECTFVGYMKCNPTPFHGNEGAVITLGLEVANRKSWAEMRTMMKEEFQALGAWFTPLDYVVICGRDASRRKSCDDLFLL
nr:hypothetical protein [Tanacetum cinerariifolium]